MKALIFLVLFLAAVVWVWHPSLRRPCPLSPCPGCGMTDGTGAHAPGGRCATCLDRDRRTEGVERAIRLRNRDADAAARRAEQERQRLADRLALVTVGSLYRNHVGEPVFDGFVFRAAPDADGELPTSIQLSGRHPRGALICGWTPAELHALAHGQACTCLAR